MGGGPSRGGAEGEGEGRGPVRGEVRGEFCVDTVGVERGEGRSTFDSWTLKLW